MAKLGEFFESQGKDVDPIVSEISIMRQLIKEHVHPLDLVRELLSNAGAREVGAAEIHINYYINQDGHVFEVTDNGCGMSYTGNKALPGRLDRFLGLGLSSIVGIKSDEFSWKGLGSKLAYQSKRVEIETFTEGEAEVYKVEIGDPWGTIERNVIPRPRIYRFPPYPGQKPGTKITVVGHPPHRKEKPFTAAELETFLLHRTFAGFTRERETRPSIVLTAQGEEKELSFGFPELRAAKECDGTQLVNEACTAKKAGTNRQFEVRLKGFYTWDADKYGLSTPSLNTGLIVSVKGIPYFAMDMEEFGSQSLRTANPGEKKCCLIVECDAIQEEMNIARSGLVDSEMTDMLKKAVASMFRDIESSQKYFAFRQVSVKRKTVESAASLHDKKRALESADQNWVTYTDANGNVILLGREPENEFDTLNLLWKMEATKALPFTRFQTLGHSHKGVDLIVHFQEDGESNPERYTVVEAERFFYNYEPHGHNPAQYVRVVCWDLGNKTKLKVEDTPKRHKKVAQAQDGVSVHVFCIKHMPGISVISRRKAEDMKLL
jgi:uncharacterized DUF497 family protein